MKTNRIAFASISLIVLVAFAASLLKIQLAHAQTDASSTDPTTFEPPAAETTGPASTTPSRDTPSEPTSTSSTASSAVPTTLTLVHTAGTTYVDYCTDGTTITAYPGDPAIDANFDKPDAPTPHCPDGQTWHHTSGRTAYDTPSGDLEVGQYALVGGAYTVHYPATTYTDATSTVEWPDRIVSGLMTDPVTGEPAPASEPLAIEASAAASTDNASSSTPESDSSTHASNDPSPAPDTSTTTDSTPSEADTSLSSSDTAAAASQSEGASSTTTAP